MELEIGPGPEPGSYVVHVLRSVGGGEPTETFRLELDELVGRRPELEASVLLSSVSARRIMADTEAALQDVGRRLFEAAFTGDVYAANSTSVAVASERGRGVQIALRLAAPGLAALPWEALKEGDTSYISARGEGVYDDSGATVGPAGLATDQFVDQGVFAYIYPFALMRRLESQTDAFSVCEEETYLCPQPGEMYLGPNDNRLDGNSVAVTATVSLVPAE